MIITVNQKPPWFFYMGWIVLNVIAVIIAWYIAWKLTSQVAHAVGDTIKVGGQSRITEDFLLLYILFPMIGLLTGILQYTLLSRYLPRITWWIAATFLGWLLPFVIGSILTAIFVHGGSIVLIILGLLLIGVSIALPQWWILRQRVRQAYWWILAYALGWLMIGGLNFFASEPIAVISAIALMPTITTSIAYWIILDLLPTRELQGGVQGR